MGRTLLKNKKIFEKQKVKIEIKLWKYSQLNSN
jgi:hypothetical protein